jgi:hypothetical protein
MGTAFATAGGARAPIPTRRTTHPQSTTEASGGGGGAPHRAGAGPTYVRAPVPAAATSAGAPSSERAGAGSAPDGAGLAPRGPAQGAYDQLVLGDEDASLADIEHARRLAENENALMMRLLAACTSVSVKATLFPSHVGLDDYGGAALARLEAVIKVIVLLRRRRWMALLILLVSPPFVLDRPPPPPSKVKSAKWLEDWMLKLNLEESRALLHGVRQADGDAASPPQNQIYTSCPRFRDQLVLLALNAGYNPTFKVMYPSLASRPGPYGTERTVVNSHTAWCVNYVETGAKLTTPSGCAVVPGEERWMWNVVTEAGNCMVRRAVSVGGVVTKVSRVVVIESPTPRALELSVAPDGHVIPGEPASGVGAGGGGGGAGARDGAGATAGAGSAAGAAAWAPATASAGTGGSDRGRR